jgi:cytochrome P450
MVLNPSVQARAQQEIDQVIGGVRLPTLADRASLPYVDALLSEVFRLSQSVPLVARRIHVDDVHDGYFLPRGSLVGGNIWWVCSCNRHDTNLTTLLLIYQVYIARS